VKFYFFPDEDFRHFLIIKMIDPAFGGKHELSSEPRDTIKRTGRRRLASGTGFRFQHFVVRFGQGVNVKGALAVGNFAAKHRRLLGAAVQAENEAEHYNEIRDGDSTHARDRFNFRFSVINVSRESNGGNELLWTER
jgi:hypothetical protein